MGQHARVLTAQVDADALGIPPTGARAKPFATGISRQCSHFRGQYRFSPDQSHLPCRFAVAAPIHLVHPRINGRRNLADTLLAIRTLGQYGQIRHRQHRAIQGKCQALHHADGNPHAGKRTRSATESDGVDRLQRGAGIGQQLLDHGQQLLRMQARDHLVMARDLAVMQQGNGASFSRGVQGQQGAHRCIRKRGQKKVRQYKQLRPASGPWMMQQIRLFSSGQPAPWR